MPGDRTDQLQTVLNFARLSSEVLLETTVKKMLLKVVDAARELTNANLGLFINLPGVDGSFVSTVDWPIENGSCPGEGEIRQIAGAIFQRIDEIRLPFRMTHQELRAHPQIGKLAWSCSLIRGLLGAPLLDGDGREVGLILVSDKREGEFTAEDEVFLARLADLSSLGLRHIEMRIEAEHRANEMDSLFASLMEGVLVINASGTIVKANPAAVWIFGMNPVGLTSEELLSSISLQRPDGLEVPALDFPLLHSISGRTTVNEQFIVLNRRGRTFHTAVSSAPVFQKSQISGAISVWHDITERERLFRELRSRADELEAGRAELARAHAELERKVHERTVDLEQANLLLQDEILVRKKAEKELKLHAEQLEISNRELKDFGFIASHDLQEPLRKIQLFGDLLNREAGKGLTQTGKDYLMRMTRAAGRMSSLISDLLSYFRLTSGPAQFSAVDLRKTLDEVVSSLEERIRANRAEIEFGEMPVIEADPVQMRVLFQHLVSNAIKFRGPDPPFIRVTAEIIEGNSRMPGKPSLIRIIIADNGIGFDMTYLDRIFTPFQRLHRKSEYPGTGIGLSICRKIVERHSGGITAESTPGRGSRFIITLPEYQTATEI